MKKQTRTIDVIIPTFNAMPWLKEAVESVLNQTYQDFKIYIVDDGSTDGSEKYVHSIKDDRITYIKREPQGRPDRNLGIRSSNSPFIAFLDADDFWYPSKLEKQMYILKSKPAVGLVYGHVYVSDEDGIIQRILYGEKRGKLVEELASGNLIAGSASMVLVRRDILEKTGPFREDLVNGEDWEMWLRIAMLCEIDFVPEVLAVIRQHGKSTQTNIVKMANGLVYAYSVMKAELKLTQSQQKKMASYCLYQAAQLYFSVGERGTARKTLFYLFRENSAALYNMDNWVPNIRFGFFSRVVFGNKLFTFVSICQKELLHGMAWFIRLPFRVARRLQRVGHTKP